MNDIRDKIAKIVHDSVYGYVQYDPDDAADAILALISELADENMKLRSALGDYAMMFGDIGAEPTPGLLADTGERGMAEDKQNHIIDAFKKAAQRTFNWHPQYRVIATWELTSRGLTLRASYGEENVMYVIPWRVLECAAKDVDPLLEMTEQKSLLALNIAGAGQ